MSPKEKKEALRIKRNQREKLKRKNMSPEKILQNKRKRTEQERLRKRKMAPEEIDTVKEKHKNQERTRRIQMTPEEKKQKEINIKIKKEQEGFK